MDFRNLNQVYPKNEFPLRNMGLLIDFAVRNAIFFFMDGFGGYNQIRMALKYVEKTAFRMLISNFYYTVMPFGLKNTGATYQRIMTTIYQDLMHHKLEDHVDDIVVNQEGEKTMLKY